MRFPMAFVIAQCKMVAYCFEKSGVDGIDSDDFAEKLLNSDYGIMLLTDERMIEYSDQHFMYTGIMRELQFKRGKSYDADVLYYAGYLYKYWISTRAAYPQRVWEIAPLKLIAEHYEFYHTQSFDYVIADLLDRH